MIHHLFSLLPLLAIAPVVPPIQRYGNVAPSGLSGGLGGAASGAAAGGGPKPRQSLIAAPPANFTHTLVVKATGVPQNFPGFLVPPGSTVRVRANNGTSAGNAQVIFVAGYAGILLSGGGMPLAPLDDQPFLVTNLASIWVMGTLGDGVVVNVSTPALPS